MCLIAPSILSADFSRLKEDLSRIESSGADWVHCDIMDGSFVPNISFGFPVLKAIKNNTKLPLDVHLMIVEPDHYLQAFADAGASVLTVHYEACTHLNRTLQNIHQLGMKAGVALNPHTPVELLRDILPDVDLVCLMSVNPGFGGQSFLQGTYSKIQRLTQMCQQIGHIPLIEIDGGVDDVNASLLKQAGASVLVAGNYFFSHSNPRQAVDSLRHSEVNRSA